MTSPTLWFLNRGSGVVLLVLFTVTVVLGILATGRSTKPLWPRFITQGLHRALAALSMVLLALHAISAVVDEYVDIRWWQALSPMGATYKPLPLGLGTFALDLLVIVTVTSLLRARMPHRPWFLLHLLTYAAWLAAIVHGLLIGTDTKHGWLLWLNVACIAATAIAVIARLLQARSQTPMAPQSRALARSGR